MREAAARAASRRGSSTRTFLSFAHGSSSSTSGTRVVLPAPGGATSTAQLFAASAAVSRGSASSIGSGVSNFCICVVVTREADENIQRTMLDFLPAPRAGAGPINVC